MPGDNLVTTVPLRFGPVYASELLAMVDNAIRVGMWDAPTQTLTWYPDDSDFLLPTCSPVHIEVDDVSAWPPPPDAAAIPPDPATVAPPIDATVTTSMYDAVSFLFEGDPPIQEGVDQGTIEPARVSVLRGYVGERDGGPLPGVLVTVVGHPEYGSTRTREDGRYDLAVNGGGPIVLSFAMEDMLPAQRTAHARWQDYTEVEDVALVAVDTEVSVIDFVEPIEVHVSSTSTDVDGSRTAALMFREATAATMVMPDASEQELTSISVRATEYTVGAQGPSAMPGDLPVASMYTYAVAYTIDEAEVAGAERVTFDPPAISYTENFVGFPVGEVVPAGSYDASRGAWIPEANGRIVEVVSETSGRADLDLDGDGNADPLDYAAAGIDDDEREAVADLYDPADELWRVELEHFSAWDFNWPWHPPVGASGPPPQGPADDAPPPDPCEAEGSILECQGQVMGERIPIAGTSFSLNYRSDRVPGRTAAYTLEVPITDEAVHEDLLHVVARLQVAGRTIEQVYLAPAPETTVPLVWDGLDTYGRTVQGTTPADLCVGYVYPVEYGQPNAQTVASFGYSGNGVLITGDRAGSRAAIWRCYTHGVVGGGIVPAGPAAAQRALGWNHRYQLGIWDARASSAALGGWTLSAHHTLAPQAGVVYRGDGKRQVNANNVVVQTVAGGGLIGTSSGTEIGELPVPAADADLAGSVLAVAVGPDGSVYIGRTDRVLRVDPEGMLHLFAGDGGTTSGGDGGPATDATLASAVTDLAVGPDGSVYIALQQPGRIRRVDPDGIITTIAGNGLASPAFGGDGGLATEASLTGVRQIAVAPDGTIYLAHNRGTTGNRLRRITPDGIITTFAGGACTSGPIDGKLATDDCILEAEGIAIGPNGEVYFSASDTSTNGPTQVFRIDADGRVAHIAGGGTPADGIGDGGPATDARLYFANRLAVSPEGLVFVANAFSPVSSPEIGNRVRMIANDGTIWTAGGRGFVQTCSDFDSVGPASAACLHLPVALALGPDGALYVGLRDVGRVRRISSGGLGWGSQTRIVASEDNTEMWVFDPQGRHESTLDTLTGATLWTFGYDGAGRLITATDAYGAVTEITRDENGEATAIVSPDGLVTTLDVPERGYLAAITNPAFETDSFTYSTGGLLETHTTPRDDDFEYVYADGGRLVSASDPEGGSKTLARTEVGPGSYEVTMTTELGRVSSYLVERFSNGGEHRVNTPPDGMAIDVVREPGGTTTVTYPGGTVVTQVEAPDPRFGMQAPVRASVLTTPGGRQKVEQTARTVTLATPGDPLSMTAFVETYTLNGRTWSWSWDSMLDEVVLESPEGRMRTITLDAFGKVETVQPDSLASISFGHDTRGRVDLVTHGTGGSARVTDVAYDTDGFIESILDPASRVHGFAYDQAGRLALRTRPDLEVVTYSYDASGNLDGVTPPGQPEHAFGHDATDRVTSYGPPPVTGVSTPSTTWSYTADHEVDVITRPDAEEIAMVYGTTNGRLEEIVTPLGSYDLTYDAAGRIDHFSDPFGGALTYGYDGILRTNETLTGDVDGSVSWTYDDDLRVASETVNGTSTVTFAYDDDSVLVAAGSETLVPDAATGLVTQILLDDSITDIGYDAFGSPTSFMTVVDATPVYDLDVGIRDALGRVDMLSETIGASTQTLEYGYDEVGRLETVTTDSVLTATYAYDENGNHTSVVTAAGTVNATYDDQDRLLSYGDWSFAYNANGDLYTRTHTTTSDVTVYEYDVMGNLRSVELPDTTFIEYVTDARDRRVGRLVDGVPTHGWLYGDQLEPVAELDETGALVSRFVYGFWRHVPDYMLRDGTTYRIVTDQIGSVRLVVDADTGAVAQRVDYDAWGNVLADTNPGFQPFGFAGGLYDPATELVRFGARDYDPSVGRWISKDPILFAGGENHYCYTSGDPVNLIDETGRKEWQPFASPQKAAGDFCNEYGWLYEDTQEETSTEIYFYCVPIPDSFGGLSSYCWYFYSKPVNGGSHDSDAWWFDDQISSCHTHPPGSPPSDKDKILRCRSGRICYICDSPNLIPYPGANRGM